jgi:hypothetical protein
MLWFDERRTKKDFLSLIIVGTQSKAAGITYQVQLRINKIIIIR